MHVMLIMTDRSLYFVNLNKLMSNLLVTRDKNA
jgi:hypothetical protein